MCTRTRTHPILTHHSKFARFPSLGTPRSLLLRLPLSSVDLFAKSAVESGLKPSVLCAFRSATDALRTVVERWNSDYLNGLCGFYFSEMSNGCFENAALGYTWLLLRRNASFGSRDEAHPGMKFVIFFLLLIICYVILRTICN